MFTSRLTPEQWAEARRLRGEGATYAAIARQFGVVPDTIGSRARYEGWSSPAGNTVGIAPMAKASPANTAEIRRGLMLRLYTLMDLKLELMEIRMQKQLKQARSKKGGDLSASEDEKDMRHLATAMKNIEQATELDPELAKSADGGARAAGVQAGASETDALRREIAERLEKLIPPA